MEMSAGHIAKEKILEECVSQTLKKSQNKKVHQITAKCIIKKLFKLPVQR